MFRHQFWPGLADGSITVAFRRWKKATVKAGGTLQTPGGLLAIDEVTPLQPDEITDDDALQAGYLDRADVLANLRPVGDLYRVRFHRLGDDPRATLRQSDRLSPEDLAALTTALRRLDWAVPVLRLIGEHPAVVSTELAPQLGMERFPFKERVRRLKALGLTESLRIGYQLSPRGRAFLAHLDGGEER